MIRRFDPRWPALLAGSALALVLAAPVLAQPQPAAPEADEAALDDPLAEEEDYEVDELVVTAGRTVPRGSVIGEAEPEITLDQREIRALGVSSVAELLTALEPQLASGRGRGGGRPITLVNGMRISSFAEIRDLPPEAIQRVEILPEEVALRYGYRADQRVMNFVLRRRFQALTLEGGATVPTAGGRTGLDANVGAVQIRRDTRQQFDFKAGRQTALLESERNVALGEGDFRTLLPETTNLSLNGVYARPLGEGIGASLNGSLEWSESTGRLGFAGAERDALGRLSDTSSAHLGGGLNGAVSGWRWSATANADLTRTRSISERGFDDEGQAWPAPNTSRSTVFSADAEGLLNGTLFDLPAGGLNAAFTVGAQTFSLEGESFRSGDFRETDLDRQLVRAQANFDAPIASRTRGGIEGIGNLSLNFNAAVEELSDFGTLTTLGGGVTWSPIEAIRLIASFTEEDGAPTVQQLGEPQITTPGVRVFDFARGTTVPVDQVSGGNPNLLADSRRVAKLGLTIRPFDETDFVIRADYTRTRIRNEIANFPALTPEIEEAFRDEQRIIRDPDTNELVQIDVRPVNFARHDQEQLRWGFNYSRPLRNTRPPPFAPQRIVTGPDGAPAGEQPRGGGQGGGPRAAGEGPGGGGFRGGGGGFRRMGGGGGGNLQFAVFHTWRIEDEVLIRPGVPVLDLLGGSALAETGGTPRHQVDLQAGISRNGLGARLNARWQEGTEVRGGPGGQPLRFSDLTTVNLRVFADLGMQPMAREHTWMRGARVTLSVDNLFDERVRVRDETGATPIRYQPDLLDPLGRTVRVSFRKLFLPRPTFIRRGNPAS